MLLPSGKWQKNLIKTSEWKTDPHERKHKKSMQISSPIDLYLNLETLFICVVCSSSAHRRKPLRKMKPQLPSPLLILLTRRGKPQTHNSLWTPDGCEGKKRSAFLCACSCVFWTHHCTVLKTFQEVADVLCSPFHSLKHSAEGKVSPFEEAKSWLNRTLLGRDHCRASDWEQRSQRTSQHGTVSPAEG